MLEKRIGKFEVNMTKKYKFQLYTTNFLKKYEVYNNLPRHAARSSRCPVARQPH